MKGKRSMKKLSVALCLLVFASTSFAQPYDGPHRGYGGSFVRWKSIVGVITAQGVDNPVSSNIHSGTFAWSARRGNASVSLTTGAAFFEVEGLVINGTMFSGTPGPITSVTGTLVCNAGDPSQEVALDTNEVPLDAQGNAVFLGFIQNIPYACGNPLFLIRIANPAGAAGRWIATGAERFAPNQGQ
jgi:hypothetical protein